MVHKVHLRSARITLIIALQNSQFCLHQWKQWPWTWPGLKIKSLGFSGWQRTGWGVLGAAASRQWGAAERAADKLRSECSKAHAFPARRYAFKLYWDDRSLVSIKWKTLPGAVVWAQAELRQLCLLGIFCLWIVFLCVAQKCFVEMGTSYFLCPFKWYPGVELEGRPSEDPPIPVCGLAASRARRGLCAACGCW